jgi:nucleotide-binding universal stress UspA family protein
MSATHRVLVPFELPDAEPVSPAVVETLTTMDAVVLGHYGLPEQTPATAARDQFEADALAELDELVGPFEAAGVPVTTRLVFGKAREKAIDRAAVEEDCDVILTPGRADAVERLFVPLRGEENFDRILSFVAELLAATDASVTLFHAGEESDRLPGEEILADATDRLVEAGVDPDRIDRRLSADADVGRSIVDLGDAFDLLVLGETEPSLRDRILGSLPAQVTADSDDPAFVVRNVEAR